MARQVVVLALVLLAIAQAYAGGAGDKSKAASAPAPSSSNSDDDLTEPPTGNVVGILEAADSPSSVRAGPIGGPVPPGAFDTPNTPNPNDASTLKFSAVAGAAALAGFFYF